MAKEVINNSPTEYECQVGSRFQRYIKQVMRLTQEEFAEIIKKSTTTISRYERGLSPIPDDIKNMLHLEYGLDLNYLISGEEKTTEISIGNMVRQLDTKHLVAYMKAISDELATRQ